MIEPQAIHDLIDIKLIYEGQSMTQLENAIGRPSKIWHYNQFLTPANTWSYGDIFFCFNKHGLALVYEEKNGRLTQLLRPR